MCSEVSIVASSSDLAVVVTEDASKVKMMVRAVERILTLLSPSLFATNFALASGSSGVDTFSQKAVVSRLSRVTRFDDYTYSLLLSRKRKRKGRLVLSAWLRAGVLRVCLGAICAAYRLAARGAEASDERPVCGTGWHV